MRLWRNSQKKSVVDVLNDEAARGQVLCLSKSEARTSSQTSSSHGGSYRGRISVTEWFTRHMGQHTDENTGTGKSATAADLKHAMRENAQIEELTCALLADVSEAQRQVPIAQEDWFLLGCKVQQGTPVNVHTVGTFGGASASFYVGDSGHIWRSLVADDYHLEAGRSRCRRGLIVFFVLCATCGAVLSWNKTAGGDTGGVGRLRASPSKSTAWKIFAERGLLPGLYELLS